jgi:DeoR family transcriptional regulator, suf operon transcriptional repressor
MTTVHPTSTKRDILQHLLKQGSATAQELAEVLEISPQAIRRHLKELELDGLIHHQVASVGMGRPNHRYQLSREGRNHFPHHYDDFAVSLLDTLQSTVGKEQFQAILQQQWQQKAADYRSRVGQGSLADRIAALAELRKLEGYMAESYCLEPEEQAVGSAPRYMLIEHNCVIANVAESHPSVCGCELEMFSAVLPDCSIERTHWIIAGEPRCGYLIQPKTG